MRLLSDDAGTDLDDPEDRRSRIRLQLSFRCEIDRFSHPLERLKRRWLILLAVGLIMGAVYVAGVDPLLIVKELLP